MSFKNKFGYFSAVVSLVTAITIGVAAPAQSDNTSQSQRAQSCADLLKIDLSKPYRAKKAIFNAYRNFSAYRSPDEKQMIFMPLTHTGKVRNISVPDIEKTSAILGKNVWGIGTRDYEFIDVGNLQMDKQSQLISRAVLEHIMRYPNQALVLHLGEHTVAATKILKVLRWAVHEAVLEKYKEAKPYLSEGDFKVLKNVNKRTGNSEVLGVLVHDRVSYLADLDAEELQERLQATIQITYFGDRNFLFPDLRSLYMAAGLDISDDGDKLPFEYRLHDLTERKFRADFYKRFAAKTTCELTRYAKFNEIPDQIHARLLFEVFRRAKSRGMKTIVASADEATMRLFKRYGFQLYAQLPTAQAEEPEFLIYIDVDAPQFQQIYNGLELKGYEVKLTHEEFM